MLSCQKFNSKIFESVEIRGIIGSQRNIGSHKAMAYFLSQSKAMKFVNTICDMSLSGESISDNSPLKDLKLINSQFISPKQRGRQLPIKLTHFSGVDFEFPTESCQEMTSNYSSLQTLSLDWRQKTADLSEFLYQQGVNLTSLKKFTYHEQSSGLQPVHQFLTRITKLELLELNVRQALLSRVLDMLYTQASSLTVL